MVDRRTLRNAADDVDAERFIGRHYELDVAAALLSPSATGRVLFVHGPGGIGKSATLRAIRRMGADAGYIVIALDPRRLAENFDNELEALLADPPPRPLVLVDEADVLGSRILEVRDRLLDTLPDTARLVFGGRERPDPSWRADGLDAIVTDLPLAPLADDEAAKVLAVRGIPEEQRAAIVTWAQGSPLALSVAAAAPGSTDGQPLAVALEARLTSWLAGRAILDVPSDALEVAALAPVVDARLLAAALPARPTREAMRQLAALPVVERFGERFALHAVLAASIRARLDATAPERARTLSRRIVKQLGTRARLGDMGALIELSQFIRDPKMQAAIANLPSTTVFPSRPQHGELAAFAAAQGFAEGPDWDELTQWGERGWAHELCVRRRDGSILLFGAFDGAADVPDLGAVTNSLRRAVAATGVDPLRSYAGIVLFGAASDQEHMEAARLGAGALMHQHGVADMQAVLIHYPAPDRRPVEVTAAIASEVDHDLPRRVALSDFRPLGAVGFVEQIVLGELGVAPIRTDAIALLAETDDPEREAQLRALLDRVFDDGASDQRLRTAIELAHLGPHRSEQECLNALHVSRSTWFRLLRQARERVLQSTGSPTNCSRRSENSAPAATGDSP